MEITLGFTVVLLVASIPLGIEIVTTLALGSKELSREGGLDNIIISKFWSKNCTCTYDIIRI